MKSNDFCSTSNIITFDQNLYHYNQVLQEEQISLMIPRSGWLGHLSLKQAGKCSEIWVQNSEENFFQLHLWSYCHGNSLGSSVFLSKTKYPHLHLLRTNMVLTLPLLIRSLGVDDTWLRQKLRDSILIKTGPAAKLLSWQHHHKCHFFFFFGMYISGAKFQEHYCNNYFHRYAWFSVLLI